MSERSHFSDRAGNLDLGLNSQSDSDNLDFYRFSGDDLPSRRLNACVERGPFKGKEPDVLNLHPYQYAEDDIRHAKSTAARLTALEKIASSGEHGFAFRDLDGVDREFRVESQECGAKTLIHCFAKDSHGNEQVVMRAARNPSGEIEQQRNRDGQPVPYYGDYWSRTMQGRTFLVGERRDDALSAKDKHENPGEHWQRSGYEEKCPWYRKTLVDFVSRSAKFVKDWLFSDEPSAPRFYSLHTDVGVGVAGKCYDLRLPKPSDYGLEPNYYDAFKRDDCEDYATRRQKTFTGELLQSGMFPFR